jgi:hypothetical protein
VVELRFASIVVSLSKDLFVYDSLLAVDISFGLNLDPLFDSNANPRRPLPFLELNQFEVAGLFGLNEWSTTLLLSGVDFAVTEAKALVELNATIPTAPLVLSSPSDFLDFVQPSNTAIEVTASLDASLPVFVVIGGEFFPRLTADS